MADTRTTNGPFPFHGVFPALLTPMAKDGSLDLAALEQHIETMLAAGVHGLVSLGSTGEFYALSPEERHDVLLRTIEVTGGSVPILAGTNASSTREVIHYSQEAQALGADGLLLAPPYYSLPTPREMLEHYRLVSRAVSIPIMLYNFPARTGVDLDVDLVESLCQFENIQAIKESTGDIDRFRSLAERLGSSISLYCGADALPLECFELGAQGWVAGIANVLPREHVRLYEAFRNGDHEAAKTLLDVMLPLLEFIEHSGCYTQLVKALWSLKTKHASAPWLPLLSPTEQETAMAFRLLEQIEMNPHSIQ